MSRTGSVLALIFTLAVSLAANIAWAARDGDPVAIAAGIATPIALVMAVHQWRAHMSARGYQKVLRVLGMMAVTGTAAAWTWTHTTRLLLEHNIETPLAYIAPLAIDGLAVMATMALWPTIPAAARPSDEHDGTEAAERDDVPSQPTPVPSRPQSVEEADRHPWDGPHAVELAPWDDNDGPASIPHPVASIPGWDTPDTDPDGIPVPPTRPRDVPPSPVVPLQVSDGTPERPTDDELVSRALEKWDPIPGIGTVRNEFGVGASRAGRVKRMAEQQRGTSQDDEDRVPLAASGDR